MFQWARRLFTKQLSERVRGSLMSGLAEHEPDPVQDNPAEEWYGRNATLFASVKQLAQASAMLPKNIVDGNDRALGDNDPAVQFARNPSMDEMPGHVFWLYMFSWLALKGDAYAFMNFGPGNLLTEAPGGPPEELLVLPASKVRPLFSDNRFTAIDKPTGYRFQDGGHTFDIHASRMFHVRDFSGVSWAQGTGGGEAANTPLSLDHWAQRWNVAGFKKGGSHLRMLFKVLYAMQNDELKKRTREQLEAQFTGDRSHDLVLMDAEMEAQPFGITHQDMEFGDLRRMNREEIATALGVPPAKIGNLEYANYANMDAQDLIFWEGRVIPNNRLMASYWNTMILPRFGRRGWSLVFDTREVRVLRENISELITSLSTMIQYGMSTPNEAISILREAGYVELATFPEGDKHYVNNGLRIVETEEEEQGLDDMFADEEAANAARSDAAVAELLAEMEAGSNGSREGIDAADAAAE